MSMDAVKFIEERNRMCDYYTKNDGADGCADCPECDSACNVVRYVTPEYIADVEKWSQKHPRKTRQSVFLEQWPEAKIEDGVLQLCPCPISASHRNAQGNCATMQRQCSDCRREFWTQEAE